MKVYWSVWYKTIHGKENISSIAVCCSDQVVKVFLLYFGFNILLHETIKLFCLCASASI